MAGGLDGRSNCGCSTTSPSICKPSRGTAAAPHDAGQGQRGRHDAPGRLAGTHSGQPTRLKSATGCWDGWITAGPSCQAGPSATAPGLAVGAGAASARASPCTAARTTWRRRTVADRLDAGCWRWTGNGSNRPASPPRTWRARRATARATSTTDLREQILRRLDRRQRAGQLDARWCAKWCELDLASERRMLGEALPPGLKLLR